MLNKNGTKYRFCVSNNLFAIIYPVFYLFKFFLPIIQTDLFNFKSWLVKREEKKDHLF